MLALTTTGIGREFASLTAVVIEGTSLFGGRERLPDALGGAALLGTNGSIFDVVGIDLCYRQVIKDFVILIAGALNVRKG